MDRVERIPWKFIAVSVGFHLLIGGIFLCTLFRPVTLSQAVSVLQVSLVDSVERAWPHGSPGSVNALTAPRPLKARLKPSTDLTVQTEPSKPAESGTTTVPPKDEDRTIVDSAIDPASQPQPEVVQLTSTGSLFDETLEAHSERTTGAPSGSDEISRFLQNVQNRLEQAKRYPWLARIQGQEGTVRVQFMIDATGEAQEIRLLESSRSKILDQEAVETVKRVGRFTGLPVSWNEKVRIDVPMVFQLSAP
jgi:protein TonB